MKQDILPGKTRWETEQYYRDHGHRAAVAAAHREFADFLDADPDSPVPPGCDITVAIAPDKATVDRWAAKHHAAAGWHDGAYRAAVWFERKLKFSVIYTPRDADENPDAPRELAEVA